MGIKAQNSYGGGEGEFLGLIPLGTLLGVSGC